MKSKYNIYKEVKVITYLIFNKMHKNKPIIIYKILYKIMYTKYILTHIILHETFIYIAGH